MQIEGILYLQLYNLNFQACVDGTTLAREGRRKKTNKPHDFILDKNPIIYASLNSNPVRSFNI